MKTYAIGELVRFRGPQGHPGDILIVLKSFRVSAGFELVSADLNVVYHCLNTATNKVVVLGGLNLTSLRP